MVALRAARHVPAAATRTMDLTRLTLRDVRSYDTAELEPDAALSVVIGPNGAGKTNLLEAIHVAITGRSHRAGSDAEIVRHGQPFGRIRAELGGGKPPAGATIELVLPGETPAFGVRKRLTVNGVPRRAATVADTARAVMFRPEEMLLLVGVPSERRRFLDGIVAQRDRAGARDLAELGRVLAQRNALLRAVRAEEAGIDALGFWDEQLAQAGARVMRSRLEVVAELGRRIGSLHDAVAAPDERGATVRLTYADTLKEAWPDRADAAHRIPPTEELVAALRRRIADVRDKEAWNGVTLVGPQRDDVQAWLGEREVALHASRGQQRTIILALKLAETELLGDDGPRPIVLLDDVFSELDRDRAGRLFGLVAQRGQVIVTTADPVVVEGETRAGAVWRIVDGRLERQA